MPLGWVVLTQAQDYVHMVVSVLAFCFQDCQYWGQGPRDWVADILGFGRNGIEHVPIPYPRNAPSDRVGRSPQGQVSLAMEDNMINVASTPSGSCRWADHVDQQPY